MSTFRTPGPLGTALGALVLSALLLGGAQAQTGQSSPMGSMPGGPSSATSPNASANASGTVTAVNLAQHKLTLDHAPIPAIGWPAMKMEFPAAPSVDLAKVEPGSKVQFTLRGANGSYTVQSITPAQ